MGRFLKTCISCLAVILITACGSNKNKSKDNTRAESTIRNDIIERSGTMLTAGSDPKDKKLQLDDARNRLNTGGGLFGKKPTNLLALGKNKSTSNTASVGFPINPYLWKGSLETISFMPLTSADPFGGIIITDWYAEQNGSNQRCKINIFIKGVELKTENLKVNSFCQKLNEKNVWIDQKTNQENNTKLENAILNKAKKIRLSQS